MKKVLPEGCYKVNTLSDVLLIILTAWMRLASMTVVCSTCLTYFYEQLLQISASTDKHLLKCNEEQRACAKAFTHKSYLQLKVKIENITYLQLLFYSQESHSSHSAVISNSAFNTFQGDRSTRQFTLAYLAPLLVKAQVKRHWLTVKTIMTHATPPSCNDAHEKRS